MNVLATEFMQWLDGLWHGKSLAFTVGVISAVLAFLIWFIGIHLRTNLIRIPAMMPIIRGVTRREPTPSTG